MLFLFVFGLLDQSFAQSNGHVLFSRPIGVPLLEHLFNITPHYILFKVQIILVLRFLESAALLNLLQLILLNLFLLLGAQPRTLIFINRLMRQGETGALSNGRVDGVKETAHRRFLEKVLTHGCISQTRTWRFWWPRDRCLLCQWQCGILFKGITQTQSTIDNCIGILI